MGSVHPTAVIDPKAEIGADVTIGPYCVVGPRVRIGDGTRLLGHVFLDGFTRLGEACEVYPFASIGTQTQDLKYRGGTPGVVIGNATTIREYVTVNCATNDGDVTRIGERCHIMAYAHIAHDCRIGDEVIIANCGTLGGHVAIEDRAVLGGLSGVHQFVRIGRMTIIGGCSKVTQDVPPFMMADGHPLVVRGINRIGLERRGFDEATRAALKEAYRILYRKGLNMTEALEALQRIPGAEEEIRSLVQFIRGSERGIAR